MPERALLTGGGIRYTLPFNPESIAWRYNQNVLPISTVGGKVIQVLSVKVEGMTVRGVAASRRELQDLANHVFAFMEYHARSQKPIDFIVTSRDWHFRVYLAGLPNVGWSVDTVGYPWMLQMEVDEDLGIESSRILQNELNRLAKGIGYDPRWSGGDIEQWLSVNIGFKGVSKYYPGAEGSDGLVPVPPGTIEQKIRAVWGPKESKNALRVARCESGLDPDAIAYEKNGSISRGIFQINSVHEGTLYRKNETQKLFDPNFNIQIAYKLWKQQGWRPWSCAKKLGIV